MLRRRARCCMTALVGGSLVLIAPPAPAAAAEAVPTPVENADHAEPLVATGTATKPPDRWTAAATQLLSATTAGHPDTLQATALNRDVSPKQGTLITRLWRVQKGAKVTVSWDDSPSSLTECKPDEVANGQVYDVTPEGTASDQPGSFTTKSTEPGKPNWRHGPERRSYSFTAGENNPKITFAAKPAEKASKCGPLLTRFTATQEPAPVPYDDKKARLPMPQAYKAHEKVLPKDAVSACNSAGACRFEKDDRYSFQYYDRPRMVGQAYINCTRNPITDQRPLKWKEFPYDNLTQYFVQEEKKPLNPRDPINLSLKEIAAQIETGFTGSDGNPLGMATTNPLLWSRDEDRTLSVTVQPGEVSWIEVQAARERVVGTLVHDRNVTRLDTTVDVPSGSFGDRFYQRTGPMSKVELTRCADARDNARTPDNTIGSPTLRSGGSAAPGLLPVTMSPADLARRLP
ncbi:hypothetical protein PUR57_10305 [Streptomyces sp. JV176]|uniref:hypothetical protein n=1 Tax=Streptomyces sp. JV176 TaxID=858630 RepID=UPI002E795142|nr:hypothetical protein [Streptomyces sp. JV176]MEE1799059.1 hypothetical protein [Streptomyces sp. JV176]